MLSRTHMNRFLLITLACLVNLGCGARTGLEEVSSEIPGTGGDGGDGSGGVPADNGGAGGVAGALETGGVPETGGVGGIPSTGGVPTMPFDCKAAGVTYIYAITEDHVLYRFDPTTDKFSSIGPLNCPGLDQVNSMAVDRTGTAYVESEDEQLFRVDLGDAACTSLPFEQGQLGWAKFGMGYAADTTDSNETL